MSSSSPYPDDRRNVEQPVPAETPSQPSPAGDPSLLDKVLEHTSEVGDAEGTLDRAETEALHGVARRYWGQPLAVEPVGRELVQAMLAAMLPPSNNSLQDREMVSRQIAQTLIDDPLGNERLTVIWQRLCEEGT